MTRRSAFWRNAVIIAMIHGFVLAGLARWSGSAKPPPTASIVWMDSGAGQLAEEQADSSPTPDPEPTPTPMEDPLTMPTPPPEEVEEPSPSATATPRPKPTPKPTPTPSAKKAIAKSPAKATTAAAKKQPAKVKATTSSASHASGNPAGSNSSARASNANWYGNMLHARFFSAWDQPTSVVATGAKMSALVRVRIESDGRVSDFALVRPSGNVVVDESVTAVGKRVTQVDPLPAGVGAGGHYEVNINFELNAQSL